MHEQSRLLIGIAVLLAGLAGFVDAFAFATLGGFFASFMSGNTTRLAVSAMDGPAGLWALAAAVLLAFVAGVMGAAIIAIRWPTRRKAAVMLFVTLLLALAAVAAMWSAHPGIILILLAMAMGAENGVFSRDGEVTIGVTYFTGNLVRMAQRLTLALNGTSPRWNWLPFFGLWLGFLGGALLAMMALTAFGSSTLWLAVAAAALLTLAVDRLDATQTP